MAAGFAARVAGFRADSTCRSRAMRILSLVRAARLSAGVTDGMAFAVGGVVIPASSLGVPKLTEPGSLDERDDLSEADRDGVFSRKGGFGRAADLSITGDQSITRSVVGHSTTGSWIRGKNR